VTSDHSRRANATEKVRGMHSRQGSSLQCDIGPQSLSLILHCFPLSDTGDQVLTEKNWQFRGCKWKNKKVAYLTISTVHPSTCHEGTEEKERYRSTLTLTSELDGMVGQRHAPTAVSPGKKTDTHFTGGWVGPRTSLDWCGKPRHDRQRFPGSSSR
jgi:hypothetical protein